VGCVDLSCCHRGVLSGVVDVGWVGLDWRL
jgi:hypothetical protein